MINSNTARSSQQQFSKKLPERRNDIELKLKNNHGYRFKIEDVLTEATAAKVITLKQERFIRVVIYNSSHYHPTFNRLAKFVGKNFVGPIARSLESMGIISIDRFHDRKNHTNHTIYHVNSLDKWRLPARRPKLPFSRVPNPRDIIDITKLYPIDPDPASAAPPRPLKPEKPSHNIRTKKGSGQKAARKVSKSSLIGKLKGIYRFMSPQQGTHIIDEMRHRGAENRLILSIFNDYFRGATSKSGNFTPVVLGELLEVVDSRLK